MNVHNMMEDVVAQRVDALYDNLVEEKATWLSCACENCRLDTTSYVLNRIPPKYVVSGRGATYGADALATDIQIRADIDALKSDMYGLAGKKKTVKKTEAEDDS